MSRSGGASAVEPGAWTRIEVGLPFIPPLEPSNLFGHLAATAVPGVEEYRDGTYRAAVRLRHAPAVVAVHLPVEAAVPAVLHLGDPRDADEAVVLARRLLDLDADPSAAAGVLRQDPVLAPLIRAVPGRRVPGALDPQAMILKAVLGQQVSTAAARTHAARLVSAFGEPVADPEGGLTHLFPSAAMLVAASDAVGSVARMPSTRRDALLAVARAVAAGAVPIGWRSDLPAARGALLALRGIGPWTVETIAMRALGDPDAFLPGDLGIQVAAARLGLPERPRELERRSRAWSPFRATAVQYLWATGVHAVNTLPTP
ncbi:DNA-3-methyladenine glycosylase family protein [uncultured Amnibacterium sp.]|uniref:DNA-3-methyladenine glycosylase family protein n=1 Tax=uncultured Amnibacterium sp. TaxID=1631851 RepID=UPI0035CAAF66